jgi:hypothetical protein
MPILLLKLTLTPLLIAAATFVQRRWGGPLGGLMVGLPLTSAPVSVFLALERGPEFNTRSAIGTLLGIVAMSGFCAVYALGAQRWSWLPSALLASFACAAVTLVMSRVRQDALTAAAISYPALLALILLSKRPASRLPTVPPPWWDTPTRMVVAIAAVALITAAARFIGPTWSGLLATLPVFAAVMGIFSHRHGGAAAARLFLRGICVGALGAATFFLVVALLLPAVGFVPGYAAAGLAGLAAAALSHAVFHAP